MKAYRLDLGIGRDRQIRSLTFCETIIAHDRAAAFARAADLTETAPGWVVATIARLVDEDGATLWWRMRDRDLEWGEPDCSPAMTTARPCFGAPAPARRAGAGR